MDSSITPVMPVGGGMDGFGGGAACLADLYVCRAAMQDKPPDERIKADGSEFAACINGKCFSEVMPFLEELMDTLKIIQPRLYDAFMAKIR